MAATELQQAMKVAKSAVIEAGEELIKHFGNIESSTKSATGEGPVDIVTHLDRQIEDFLAEKLGDFDSSIGFQGEESGIRSKADTIWLVDPIDGTGHFVRGLPFCTTMVALIENNQVVLAVINDFVRGELYSAIKGQGAYRNDKPIQVSTRPLADSLISFETRLDKPANMKGYLKVRKIAALFSTISCGFEFIAVASGKIDGRIAKDPYGKDWDFAPGSLLVTEAGGIATNMGAASYDFRNHDYIISNPVVHRELTTGKQAIFPPLK